MVVMDCLKESAWPTLWKPLLLIVADLGLVAGLARLALLVWPTVCLLLFAVGDLLAGLDYQARLSLNLIGNRRRHDR